MLQIPGHELNFAICIFWLNTLKLPDSFATDLLTWVNATLFPISAAAALACAVAGPSVSVGVTPHLAVCNAVIVVLNVGSATQVCTQPQICDERPHWELRPYLTHGEAHHPPALSHSLSPLALSFLISFQLSASREEGAAAQRKALINKVTG